MNQFYNAASTNVTVQSITTSGTALPYIALQPVTAVEYERDFRSLRDLTPVEWLRRQVEDVCLRAAMA